MSVNVFIEGVPHAQKKVRGNIEAPVRWTSTVVQKTKNLPKVKGPSLRLLLGHATLSMVLRYSRYVDVQRALTEHHLFNPLDRLMRGQTNGKRGWHY